MTKAKSTPKKAPELQPVQHPLAHPSVVEFQLARTELEGELQHFEYEIEDFTIDGQADLELAAEITATVKGHSKRTTAMMKKAIAPVDEWRVDVQRVFKPMLETMAKIEAKLKKKVGDFHLRRSAEEAEALRQAAQANRAGKSSKAEAALARADAATVEPIRGMTVRYTIDIEIGDENLIPDEWWAVDTDRIGKFARSTNGEVQIPGVIYHKRPIVASGSR